MAQWYRTCLQCRRHRSGGFDPCVGKISWRRTWQPTPVFLPGKIPGTESLLGCSPRGCRVRHDLATDHAHTHSSLTKEGYSSLPKAQGESGNPPRLITGIDPLDHPVGKGRRRPGPSPASSSFSLTSHWPKSLIAGEVLVSSHSLPCL